MWKYAKNPYQITFYYKLSEIITKILLTILNARKKCVVLDLDNTLCEGVIGEDGVYGTKITKFNEQLQKYMHL